VESILVYPDPPPRLVCDALAEGGYTCEPLVPLRRRAPPVESSPHGAEGLYGIVTLSGTPAEVESGVDLLRSLRRLDGPAVGVLVIADEEDLRRLGREPELFEDFVLAGAKVGEVVLRLARLVSRLEGSGPAGEIITYGPLALNLATYQAMVAGRPLDLTYMEYELLRFLASRPGRVCSRETLLASVWGYEYLAGVRTVDVHVRRLRAKLGEEHAHLIETVRSVGYRLGSLRWHP